MIILTCNCSESSIFLKGVITTEEPLMGRFFQEIRIDEPSQIFLVQGMRGIVVEEKLNSNKLAKLFDLIEDIRSKSCFKILTKYRPIRKKQESNEFEFWKEAGEHWVMVKDLDELINIVTGSQKSLGYNSKEDMLRGFFTGIIESIKEGNK